MRRGGWGVFCYDDVQEVLSNYAAFSSQFQGEAPQRASNPLAASLISLDPPRHRQLRALVSQAFTPRAIEALAPRISTIVDELLDRALPAGQIELVSALAEPLPVIVIAELLGIPSADRARFKVWSDAVVSFAAGGMSSFQAQREMVAYFMRTIEERRRAPSADLISALLRAEVAGEQLSLPELLGFCVLLLVAGNETTTNLIGNAMLCLAERPDVWAQLRAEPARISQAVEEVLRFRSPVQAMFRVTTREVTLRDQHLPPGAPLVAYIGSANHDETRFAAPENFDITRSGERNIAFGHGIHYCLGAPLARLEARIALRGLAERIVAFEREPGQALQAIPSSIVYGVRRLPLRVVSTY
jgi:cytochrome P450